MVTEIRTLNASEGLGLTGKGTQEFLAGVFVALTNYHNVVAYTPGFNSLSSVD